MLIVLKLIKTVVYTRNDQSLGGKVHTHQQDSLLILKTVVSPYCHTTCRRSTYTCNYTLSI